MSSAPRSPTAADRSDPPPDPPPDLPPNQVATRAFPLIGDREPEPFDAATWTLRIDGAVDSPREFTIDAFRALPRAERGGTIHCVTRWSRPGTVFRGVALATLLDAASPRADARFVRFASGRGHDTTLPLAACRDDALLADELLWDGAFVPLPPEHGGPVRSVMLPRYFYKSVKWVRRIELLTDDRLGTWERTAGYHNRADPWQEERYVVRGIDRARLKRLIAARDLSGEDLLGADLAGRDLRDVVLRGTSLRNTDLDGADLRGADLRGANLTNATLRGTDLRGALIEGIDIDGADLRGADLRETKGCPVSLACAEFAPRADAGAGTPENSTPEMSTAGRAARLGPLDWSNAPVDGILPAQRAHLLAEGVRLRSP